MAANEIVAEHGTLTGSIGVVLAGLELEGVLSQIGVNLESIQRGKHAGIYAFAGARSEEERALLKRQVARLYEQFTRNAAESRSLSPADLEAVAQGRVWSGRQAVENKLVDRLGGLELARERAEVLAGLEPGEGVPLYCAPQAGGVGRLLRADPLADSSGAAWAARFWCPLRVDLA
jgi:protease-4